MQKHHWNWYTKIMDSNKNHNTKQSTSTHSAVYSAAAFTVTRRPTVCAMDLSDDLTFEELAELRPLCGMGCEDGCPYAC